MRRSRGSACSAKSVRPPRRTRRRRPRSPATSAAYGTPPSAGPWQGKKARAVPVSERESGCSRQKSLGRDDGRALGVLRHLSQLRLEPVLEHAVDAVEIDIDDRRDEKRQQLRQNEPADHGDAERLAQLGAGTLPIALGTGAGAKLRSAACRRSPRTSSS